MGAVNLRGVLAGLGIRRRVGFGEPSGWFGMAGFPTPDASPLRLAQHDSGAGARRKNALTLLTPTYCVTLSGAKGLVCGGTAPPRMFRRCGWLSMTFDSKLLGS